jgi:hypothetical protein
MNAIVNQVEVNVETQPVQLEEFAALDGLKELSSIELAYVGGGTASVSFI